MPFIGARMEESCATLVRLGRGKEIGDVRSGGGGVDILGLRVRMEVDAVGTRRGDATLSVGRGWG